MYFVIHHDQSFHFFHPSHSEFPGIISIHPWTSEFYGYYVIHKKFSRYCICNHNQRYPSWIVSSVSTKLQSFALFHLSPDWTMCACRLDPLPIPFCNFKKFTIICLHGIVKIKVRKPWNPQCLQKTKLTSQFFGGYFLNQRHIAGNHRNQWFWYLPIIFVKKFPLLINAYGRKKVGPW